MAEYNRGFMRIREPDDLLPEGTVVPIHTHREHHATDFTMGLWGIIRRTAIVDSDGIQLRHAVKADYSHLPEDQRRGRPEFVETEMWHDHPAFTIQGGGPKSVIEIPKNMAHKFVLLKGWGFFRCMFAQRDGGGNLVEVWSGFQNATE